MNGKLARWDWKWLLLLFLAMGAATGLGGEYPLNDDWIFASGVRSVLEDGELAYLGYAAPNLLLQVAWGALWCSIGGGFSFVVLRLSVLAVAGLGIFAMYRLALVISGRPEVAFLAGLVLLFHPLYYHLSFTFMTDVPFAALALLSLWQYALFFEHGRKVHRWTGALAAVLAFLVRQPGLMIWVVAEAVIWLGQPKGKRRAWHFGAHFLGAAVLYVTVEYGLKAKLGLSYHRPEEALVFTDPLAWLLEFLKRSGMSLFYIGLFLLPFLPNMVKRAVQGAWWRTSWFLGLVFFNLGLALSLWYAKGLLFPYSGNTLYNLGLGAPMLADFHYEKQGAFPQLPAALVFCAGMVVQVYSCLLAKLFMEEALRCLRTWSWQPMDVVAALFAGLHALIVYLWSFIDRYVLMLSVLGLYFLVRAGGSWWRLGWAGWALLLALGGYVVAGTHDYLAWNGVVKDKKEEMMEDWGLSREEISVSYAQNGWDSAGCCYEQSPYWLAWGRLEGRTVVDSVAYARWLPGEGKIFVLKKE